MLSEEEYKYKISPAYWVKANNFINENQKPFEFTKHRFMIEPYNDHSADQAIRKSAQVGWSVAAILKSVHAAKYLNLNIIYVLPTRNASSEFVVPKVNPLLQRNPIIKAMVQNTDNKSLKQVGDRFIYFRGAHHEGEAISTSADLIVSDEFDRSDQAILTMMQSRLQASDYGWFWRFSNPSLPGFGVDEWYQESDQKHWMVTCPHCKHEYFMGFERDDRVKHHYIDIEQRVYCCGKCHKLLKDSNRQKGRWVAKFPSRSRRGYWLSQMMVPWVTADKILTQRKQMSIEVFHNMVLGLPYQASEFLINRESIMRARVDGVALKEECYLGVDNGKEKHWVLGNRDGLFAYGKATEWEEIEQLINMYDATTVIDALPDFTIPQQLTIKYPGKVFVNYYTHDSKMMEVSIKNEGVNYGRIDSDRTKLFDSLAANITNKQLRFFLQPKSLDDLIYHFEQMYRIVEPDTRGIDKAKWETKENRPDHWAHATAYYLVAKSFGLAIGETGAVKIGSPVKGVPITVKRGTIPVKDALGDLDDLVERSIGKAKKKKVE